MNDSYDSYKYFSRYNLKIALQFIPKIELGIDRIYIYRI